jgi:hypothetical protein
MRPVHGKASRFQDRRCGKELFPLGTKSNQNQIKTDDRTNKKYKADGAAATPSLVDVKQQRLNEKEAGGRRPDLPVETGRICTEFFHRFFPYNRTQDRLTDATPCMESQVVDSQSAQTRM